MGSVHRLPLNSKLGALTAVALVACAVSVSANVATRADDSANRPASPEHGRSPVSANLSVPRMLSFRSDASTMVCQVLVSRAGEVSERKCAQRGGGKALATWLRTQTHERLERARFRPALVDGAKVAVSMPVRVHVECDAQGSCQVGVYPNAGLHRGEQGERYFAPQEIIDEAGTWYDRLVDSEHCRGPMERACKGLSAFAFAAAVGVDQDGRVSAVSDLASISAGDFPADAAFDQLGETRYIPAESSDGERLALRLNTPTIHMPNSRRFPRNQCRRVEQVGARLGISCFTMQELAAHRRDDHSGLGDTLTFWLSADNAGS